MKHFLHGLNVHKWATVMETEKHVEARWSPFFPNGSCLLKQEHRINQKQCCTISNICDFFFFKGKLFIWTLVCVYTKGPRALSTDKRWLCLEALLELVLQLSLKTEQEDLTNKCGGQQRQSVNWFYMWAGICTCTSHQCGPKVFLTFCLSRTSKSLSRLDVWFLSIFFIIWLHADLNPCYWLVHSHTPP